MGLCWDSGSCLLMRRLLGWDGVERRYDEKLGKGKCTRLMQFNRYSLVQELRIRSAQASKFEKIRQRGDGDRLSWM